MYIELDGRLLTDRKAVHDTFSEKLNFPSYYGRNLDALYDLLTEISEPLEICIIHADQMETMLGAYGNALIDTLKDAQSENANLTITFMQII